MLDWALLPLKRYADFSGRSRRKEYWMFTLMVMVVYLAISLVFGLGDPVDSIGEAAGAGIGALIILGVALAFFIPGLAVTVRRFHDQDKTGWLAALGLIPFVGGLILLVFMCLEGTRGPNRYGPDPKEAGPGA